MTNWCSNIVTITGSAEELDYVQELLALTPQHPFQALRPIADDKNTDDCRYLWGTRCEPDPYVESESLFKRRDSQTLVGHYGTAWTPALDVFVPITALLSSLVVTVEYNEGGCDFSGVATISNGVVTRVFEGVAKEWCVECGVGRVRTDMGSLSDWEFVCRSCITNDTELICYQCQDVPPAEGFLTLCEACAELHPEDQRSLAESPEHEEVATTQ